MQPPPLKLSGTKEERIAQIDAYYRAAVDSARDHGIRVSADNGFQKQCSAA